MKHSIEHQNYLKKKKRTKILVLCTQLAILMGFLLLWYALVKTKTINEFIFSSPLNVVRVITDLIQAGNFWNHIAITCMETAVSFTLVLSVYGVSKGKLKVVLMIVSSSCEAFLYASLTSLVIDNSPFSLALLVI